MIEKIVNDMNITGNAKEVQKIQTAHRIKLIEFWEIPEGARVLEIGCGQGDTLASLAYVVGENGFVHGVDIADENYGAPETLGQAKERLLKTALGKNIRMDFNFDIMDGENYFDSQFDYVVLSHCLWYFSSYDELRNILTQVKAFGKNLCLAEWNPSIHEAEQLSHLKAVSVQAICECFKISSYSNVRTMFYPKDIERAVLESGWVIEKVGSVYSKDIQDGQWEVSTVTEVYPSEIEKLKDMPTKLKQLLFSQIEELRGQQNIKPMPAYCLKASF